ncbi:MAG: hypothetical protein ACOC80_16340 [Petrotogales bacterium]
MSKIRFEIEGRREEPEEVLRFYLGKGPRGEGIILGCKDNDGRDWSVAQITEKGMRRYEGCNLPLPQDEQGRIELDEND